MTTPDETIASRARGIARETIYMSADIRAALSALSDVGIDDARADGIARSLSPWTIIYMVSEAKAGRYFSTVTEHPRTSTTVTP